MVDWSVPQVCGTRGGGAVLRAGISPALQHTHFEAACHPTGFSSPKMVVGTPNTISQSEAQLLRHFPSVDHCQSHLHENSIPQSGNWGGDGRESREGGTQMDPSLPGPIQTQAELFFCFLCPTGKRVPKDSITSRIDFLFTKCHPTESSVFTS